MTTDEEPTGWSAVMRLGEATAAAIQSLTTKVISLDASMADLTRDVGDLKKDVGVLRSDILSVRTDVMSRMDRLQDKLSAVTDDLTVNYGAAMKSERLARNSLEEVRDLSDHLTTMQIQIRRISAKVFGPDDAR